MTIQQRVEAITAFYDDLEKELKQETTSDKWKDISVAIHNMYKHTLYAYELLVTNLFFPKE